MVSVRHGIRAAQAGAADATEWVSHIRTLTAVFEDAVRTFLTLQRRGESQPPIVLPTYGDGGVRPGVDLDDSASLLDLMEH